MQVTDVLVGCLVGIALAVFGYSLVGRLEKIYYFYKQKKMRTRIVQEVLNLTLVQRSTFRLEVLAGDYKGFTGEAVCNVVGKDFFVLQLLDAFGAHQWTDVSLRMFFPVNQKGKMSFYHLTSVASKSVRKDHVTELTLNVPYEILAGQNRETLRFSPPKHSVLGLGMWIMNPGKPLPTHKNDLEKPHLAYTSRGNNDMGLENISAGGMCLVIHERAMWHRSQNMKPGAHLLFLLVLANKEKDVAKPPRTVSSHTEGAQEAPPEAAENTHPPAKSKTSSFWLSCRVRALLHMEKENFWKVCLQYDAWSHIEGEVTNIVWFPTDGSKTVPPLSTWILRTHLDLMKKT